MCFTATERDRQCSDDPGDGRVDAAGQHREPQDRRKHQVRPQPPHAGDVEERHHPGDDQRCAKRVNAKVGGVEQGDDQHRADVVDDGDGHQQQLDRRRRARPEQRENADGKGNVGRCGDRPAVDQRRIELDDADEDQRGQRHAGGGGDEWKAPLGSRRQPSFIPFALHLQPDQQEE